MTNNSIRQLVRIIPLQKHLGSVFQDEQELLKTIIELHVPTKAIELDPMYFKGNFYKEIPKPKHIFDLNPIKSECKQGDAKSLPFQQTSIYSMILDPPFVFGVHGKEGKHQKEYYSSATHGIFKNLDELLDLYEAIIKEASRILMIGGILIFKCQDYTDSKTTLTHCLVYNLAMKYGFYAKDLAILYLSKGKITNPTLKQRHLRKHHSYFFVFVKQTTKLSSNKQKGDSV